MSGRSPLHGYNTNYRREGVVYHVQTEDLGEPAAAIVTQVFTGGTILAKKRTEYKEILGADDLEAQLRSRMQKQHKELLIAVRDGEIKSDAPVEAAARESKKAKLELPLPEGVDLRDTVQMQLPPEFYEELDIGTSDDNVIIEDFPPPSTAPAPEVAERDSTVPPAGQSAKSPPPGPADSPRAPAPPSPSRSKLKLPPPVPPPKISSRVSPKVTQHASPPPPPSPASQSKRTPLPPPIPPEARSPKLKPAAKKAQAVVQPSEPQPQRRPRIFEEISRPSKGIAEEQLGERSLDEVILSYLAEDLQEE